MSPIHVEVGARRNIHTRPRVGDHWERRLSRPAATGPSQEAAASRPGYGATDVPDASNRCGTKGDEQIIFGMRQLAGPAVTSTLDLSTATPDKSNPFGPDGDGADVHFGFLQLAGSAGADHTPAPAGRLAERSLPWGADGDGGFVLFGMISS